LKCYNLPPDLELIPKSFEEDISTVPNLLDLDVGESIFSALTLGDFSFQLPCHFLLFHLEKSKLAKWWSYQTCRP